MHKFAGIWPALVTPLTADGQVNVEATESLIEDLIACGIGGLYVCGGTGEGVLLSPAVRQRMAETAIGAVAGRVPVMVHVGSINCDDTLALAAHAARAGADAISAIPPFYYSYPFPTIRDHYQRIAAASDLPLYLYYIPGSTGAHVTPEQLLEICALDGVSGFKYTSHDLEYLSRVLALRDESVNVLSGPDQLLMPCLALGVDGAIGSTYNLMPRLYIDLMHLLEMGDLGAARELQFRANAIISAMYPFGIIPAAKAMLNMLGHDVGQAALPLPQMDAASRERLRARIEEAGYLGLVARPSCTDRGADSMRGRFA